MFFEMYGRYFRGVKNTLPKRTKNELLLLALYVPYNMILLLPINDPFKTTDITFCLFCDNSIVFRKTPIGGYSSGMTH